MKHISVIGCGTMGNGIAQTFALFEFKVKLYDISLNNLDNAKKTILRNLERMVMKEKITPTQKENTLESITTKNNIEDSIKDVDLVIEAATENTDIKLNIFKELDM